MTGVDFEDFLVSIFQELGYGVSTSRITDEQGVDLIVSKNGRKVAVQAERASRQHRGEQGGSGGA